MQATSALDLASSLHWNEKQNEMLSTWVDPNFVGPGRSALRKNTKLQKNKISLADFLVVQDPIQGCTFFCCPVSPVSFHVGQTDLRLSLSCTRLTFMEVQPSYFGFVQCSLLRPGSSTAASECLPPGSSRGPSGPSLPMFLLVTWLRRWLSSLSTFIKLVIVPCLIHKYLVIRCFEIM